MSAAPAKTTKKSRPAASAAKRGPSAGRQVARWTDDQVRLLHDAVAAAPSAKAGFEQAARQLDKSVGTVQQKYYALKRSQGPGRRRGPSSQTTPSGTRSAGSAIDSRSPLGSDALARLTVDELTAVARRVKAEVERRRSELEKASRLFG